MVLPFSGNKANMDLLWTEGFVIFETNHIQKSQQVPHFFLSFLYEIKADILSFKFLSVILAVLKW